MSQASSEYRDVSMTELASVLDRVKPAVSEADHETLAIAVQMLGAVLERIHAQDASIADLRAFLSGMKSEKRSKLGKGEPKGPKGGKGGATGKEKKKRKGHGRTGTRTTRGLAASTFPTRACARVIPARAATVAGSTPWQSLDAPSGSTDKRPSWRTSPSARRTGATDARRSSRLRLHRASERRGTTRRRAASRRR